MFIDKKKLVLQFLNKLEKKNENYLKVVGTIFIPLYQNKFLSYTEKILTFSSEWKMFLEIERKMKMFSFRSNQVELVVFTFYISTNKLLVLSEEYTYQKVVK